MADPPLASSSVRQPIVRGLAVVVGVAVLAFAVLAGAGWGRPDGQDGAALPRDTSVDAGFARDMQRHHAQAVQLSLLILDRTDDEAVRILARDVLLTQQQQIGQMYAWLEMWGLNQASSEPAMGWMTSSSGSTADHMPMRPGAGSMPGMATPAEVSTLTEADGRRADRLYLRLLIPHHRGALGMARYAAEHAELPEVRTLAKAILESQAGELVVLREMARHLAPPEGPGE